MQTEALPLVDKFQLKEDPDSVYIFRFLFIYFLTMAAGPYFRGENEKKRMNIYIYTHRHDQYMIFINVEIHSNLLY